MSRQSEDWSHFVPHYLQTSSRDNRWSQGPRSLSCAFSSELASLTGLVKERHSSRFCSQVAETEKKGRGFERKRILFCQEFPNRADTQVFLFQAKGTRKKNAPSHREEEWKGKLLVWQQGRKAACSLGGWVCQVAPGVTTEHLTALPGEVRFHLCLMGSVPDPVCPTAPALPFALPGCSQHVPLPRDRQAKGMSPALWGVSSQKPPCSTLAVKLK